MKLGLIGWLGFVLLTGCGERRVTILGQSPANNPEAIAKAKTVQDSILTTVQGVMIEKCPVAGCWFILRDTTGTIKVDTKTAGFVVVDVPLKTAMTVEGRVVANGEEKMILATGLSY